MRLPNGFGSVTKLSGSRRTPWLARVTIGEDPETGSQLRYTVGYYKTRAEALAALSAYNNNPIGERGDITLGNLYSEWSAEKFPKIASETARSYIVAWDNHLNKLEQMKVKDIKTSHLQKIIDGMVTNGLSYSSCHKVKVLAGLLLKQAMADDITSQNYAELVQMPKMGQKKRDNFFTDLEVKKIAEAAQADEWASAILILIYTGFRISELLELTKFNVDTANMVITGGIKTDAGRDRAIPIHPIIQPYVLKWHDKQGTALIQRNNERIRPDYFRKSLYYPTLEQLDVRRLSPHATRHTFASMLARANASPKASQDLLGHADYSTTANIYTHTDLSDLRKAIESI